MKKPSIQKVRILRRHSTDTERRLWSVLRHRQLQNYKFRRQHPVGPYVADFACITHRLIIEADGGQHLESGKDAERTAELENLGWRVVRFWNHDILKDTDTVLTAILQALEERRDIIKRQ